MGGRIAEEIVLKQMTTGSVNDIERGVHDSVLQELRAGANREDSTAKSQECLQWLLSLEVVGREGHQPLWFWLVTQGNLVWNNIVDDLAGRAVKKLIEASASSSAQPQAPTVSSRIEQTSLNGQGKYSRASLERGADRWSRPLRL